ncbi:usherin [Menidia menidia]
MALLRKGKGLPSPSPPGGGGGGGGGGDRAEGSLKGQQVVRELWFIVVMAAVALLLLAVVLAVVLHKVLNKPHLTRERPPLVALPMQKRSPMAVYPPSNSVLFDTVPDTTSFSNSVTLKGFTMKIEEVVEVKCEPAEEAPPQGELSVGVLRRSVSQVMDGKPFGGDDDVWDPNISGHDSGMFMDDEEFVDTVKGFSTVRKEHTMFTDTNL